MILIFLGIFIEVIPFILIGILLSSFIQVFVSEELIRRRFSGSSLPTFFLAGVAGMGFPVCECGIIPLTRRLIGKGVAPSVAITFMLAVPIVNPVVMASTYYAFAGDWGYVIFRTLAGIVVSIIIGYAIKSFYRGPVLKEEALMSSDNSTACEQPDSIFGDVFTGEVVFSCGCSHDHHHHDCSEGSEGSFTARLWQAFNHAGEEFFYVGRFFIVGALLASLVHVLLPRELVMEVGQAPFLAIPVMMLFAFLLSLCSEADAFIAASFTGMFTAPALMAFMVFGPMLDVKNFLMMSAVFSWRFLLLLVGLIVGVVFLGMFYLDWLLVS